MPNFIEGGPVVAEAQEKRNDFWVYLPVCDHCVCELDRRRR